MQVPARVEVLNIDLTEFTNEVLERRPDTVLRVTFGPGRTGDDVILVVESQTDRADSRQKVWPHHVACLRDKYGMQVILLVVSSKASTAQWARKPVITGAHGLTCRVTTPVVAGPDTMPEITRAGEAARNLPFAVLAALTHSRASGCVRYWEHWPLRWMAPGTPAVSASTPRPRWAAHPAAGAGGN